VAETDPTAKVLVNEAAELAVTLTETIQLVAAARLAPLRLKLPEDALAVNAPPVQVVLAFGVAAIVMPAGKLSVKANPDKLLLMVLMTLTVNTDVWPGAMAVG